MTEVEHGSFTPLVFSSCGGMGSEAKMTLKKLASLMSEKTHEKYNPHTLSLLRMRLSFALARAAITCLRGSRIRRTPETELHRGAEIIIQESQIHN